MWYITKERKIKVNRKELNKFYTSTKLAKKLIDRIIIDKYDLIIEPSAGDGSFSKQINNILAFDLFPESADIVQQDWFTLDKKQFKKYKNILVIGNPPYGKNGSLALKFIKESSFANTIAFILPKSFMKESMKDKVPVNFSLQEELELTKEECLFNIGEEKIVVPSVFQVWQKTNKKRTINKKKNKSDLFDFTDKANADFRIQRVGGKTGTASFDLNYSESSNYFIKNKSSLSSEQFVDFINNLHFKEKDKTTGPRSLSKNELITEIERNWKYEES